MIVGRGGGRKRGSRGILSQCAFTSVESLPVVVSGALPLVVIGHRVLRYAVSSHAGYLESSKQRNLFADFGRGMNCAERAPGWRGLGGENASALSSFTGG